jgi:hypothetical protein
MRTGPPVSDSHELNHSEAISMYFGISVQVYGESEVVIEQPITEGPLRNHSARSQPIDSRRNTHVHAHCFAPKRHA